MRPIIIVSFIALGLLIQPTLCRSQNEAHLSTFEIVWKTVNETYFDPTFGGLNWKDIHDRYLPQIMAARTTEEFYRLVNMMLWELKVSHANMIPPGSFALYEPLVFAEGSPGLDVRMLNGTAVITFVKPESPASQAGLRPGYVIRAVDGVSVGEIVREAESRMSPPDNSRGRIARITKRILGRIYGPPGTAVSIVYSDNGGENREKKIARAKRNGVAVGPKIFFATEFEAKRLDSGIGYLRVNTLQPQFAALISRAIRSMGDVRGIIFDLRGNSGGEIEGMPDLFLKERTLLYLKRSRNGETKVFFDPAEDAFKGPLVLLIDPLTGSAGELFAASLQAIGRAVVVGERSPGSVMEMDRTILQNGAIFMYPVAQPATPDGTVLEGHGVIPNIEVGLDREALLKGTDSQLDSAIGHIRKQISSAYAGTVFLPGGRRIGYAIPSVWMNDLAGGPVFNTTNVSTIVHEFCRHSITPLVLDRAQQLEKAGNIIFARVRDDMEREHYGHWSIESKIAYETIVAFLWMRKLIARIEDYSG